MKKTTISNPLKTLLLDAGLSDKEAKVYLVLLEKGTLSAPEIVKASGLKKGITYTILHKLALEELVVQFERDKKLHYQPSDPTKLKAMVERRKKAMDEVAKRIDSSLPALTSSYKLAVGKPTIQYYEGEEGIKAVFENIYGKKEKDPNVYGCVDLEKANTVFPSYIINKLIPKRIRNKIVAHTFIANSPLAQEIANKDAQELRQSVLLDKTIYPLPAEIDVYEDKVAMLSFERNQFIGILITNQAFADSLRSIFRLAQPK